MGAGTPGVFGNWGRYISHFILSGLQLQHQLEVVVLELVDGSKCCGHYGPNVNLDTLKDFHRRRLQVLVEAGANLPAFETIPNKLEAQACAELLKEENVQIPSWVCFTSVDGKNAPSGESFKECPDLTGKAIIFYPNSGKIWDGVAKNGWWRDAGAKLISGCCRTTPTTIHAISKVLKERSRFLSQKGSISEHCSRFHLPL
ncbi:hypothetical protein ACH5RR_030192 [Cinchona calisaya]|uniref:Hcy-binding domain-containing protein n=1 Tax=Cinchona calisaya TaxID=153742 RepID=A0ABD2YW43_9GENT